MTDNATTQKMIPLNKLRHGSDPAAGVSINARVTNKTDGAQAIAASMRAIMRKLPGHSGVIQPLGVARADRGGQFFVLAGGVRLAALHLLLADGTITEEHGVPAIIHGDVGELNEIALEMSVLENEQRTPLHPADAFVAYAAMYEGLRENGGMAQTAAVAEIAAMFAVPPRTVRQRLALGAGLTKNVLDAWRAGDVTAETAALFTLADDATQDTALIQLVEDGNAANVHSVRHALGLTGDAEAQRALQFIGADAYRDAGGKVMEDLFGINHQMSHPGLAVRLAHAKLEAEAADMVRDGWKWASSAADISGWQGWPRKTPKLDPTDAERERASELEGWLDDHRDDTPEADERADELAALEDAIEARAFTDTMKKKLGCVVYLAQDGKLATVRGIEQPKEAPAPKPSATTTPAASTEREAATTKDPAATSHAVNLRLLDTLTQACGLALDADPHTAMAALLAAVFGTAGGGPVRASTSGRAGRNDAFKARFKVNGNDDFVKLLKRFRAMATPQRAGLLTMMVADALDLHDGLEDEQVAALVGAIPARAMTKHLRNLFDRRTYFEGVSRELCVAAIHDCQGKSGSDRAAKMSKADVVKFCLSNVGPTWLPPQLRTKHYDGPKSKPRK